MELNDVMRTAFSARQFTDEELPDSVLYEILENARFAPSGGNRQGNRVIVIRDDETREKLIDLTIPQACRYMAQVSAGERPFNTINPSQVTESDIAKIDPPARLLGSMRGASVILVFVVDLTVVASMDKDLDRVGMISGASIYPFVWNVLLGARQAGYGGVLTTLPVAAEPKLKDLLGIPDHFAAAAVVPLGKPVKQLTKLKRRPVEEIAVRDRFDGAAFSGA
jgi:nitroreductase